MDLSARIYHDEDAARAHLERINWPDGPVCPHCRSTNAHRMQGASHTKGALYCRDCRKKFTVTVGTIFERSHIPLHKWMLAFRLMAGSKKGMSAHQLHRSLGVTYKSAWFMAHRIREAMRVHPNYGGPLGGAQKVVEADETYVGGKARNRATRAPAPKKIVFSLVERDGNVRSFHVANVTGATLAPIIKANIHKASATMTDEAPMYPGLMGPFNYHGTVNHSAKEYARGFYWHTNTIENFFSLLKRGIIGTYHHVSEAHLHRYTAEFDFRYNTRTIKDTERADKALRAAKGKRLTYRRPVAPPQEAQAH
jgi:transposase-like protein